MRRQLFLWLASAGFVFALSVNPWAGQTAHADDDDDRVRQELTVTEVLVNFDTTDTIRITVQGADLDAAESVAVSLGEQGELEVLSASGNEILAICPDDTCEDGDFRLTVSVQAASMDGDDDDDDNESRLLTAAYDLTIGAVGPQGPEGPQGAQGDPGVPGAIDLTKIRVRQVTAGTVFRLECAVGEQIVGGGAACGTGADLVQSYPVDADPDRYFAECGVFGVRRAPARIIAVCIAP